MEFSKLSAPSLKELFIQEMETMILSGRLKVGERLPSERELAQSMQVSRSVVNAGIAGLASKGFLVVRPRIGVFVEDYRRNGTLNTLIAIVRYNGGILRRDEMRSILEMRIALDTLAVELGIPRMSDNEIAQLRSYVEQMEEQFDSPQCITELAFAFQHELAFLSGNTLIPLIFTSFKELVVDMWVRFCELYGTQALHENTDGLCGFIERRDIDGAVQHIRTTVGRSLYGDRQIYY